MKIAIVTVYNTENCGSFLQAYALRRTLEKLGNEVYYLYRDLKDTSNSLKNSLKCSLIKMAKFNFGYAANVLKMHNNYNRINKKQPVVHRNSKLFDEIECFVFGSDTIWNFNSQYFYNNRETYLGSNLPDVKKITYAVSAANTPYKVFEKDDTIKSAVNNLDFISVRDDSTKDIVEKLTGAEPYMVCDPTLLLDEKEYDEMIPSDFAMKNQKYILLYHFSDISQKKKEQILQLKKQTGCKIVSFGEYRSWCDYNPAYEPYSFIAYMKYAQYVITDTFHGTIFAVLFHKNFIDYGVKKVKITDFISQIGLMETLTEENDLIVDKFKVSLDYKKVDEVIMQLRSKSLNYIKNALGENC